MISKNTFGIQFIIRVNKTKDDKVPIYVRITVDSQRVEMSLKRWVQPIEWNAVKGLARGSRKEITALNTYLEQVRARLVVHDFRKLLLIGILLSEARYILIIELEECCFLNHSHYCRFLL
jgi:hypothetical protein